MGLAVDAKGFMYVADTGNGRIQKLNPMGLPVFTISSNHDRQLYGPQGVEVDSKGVCYVADTFSHCVVEIDGQGREITRFGCRGESSGSFDEPQDLVLDQRGFLYVIEMANNRLQVFDAKCQCVTCFDGDSIKGLASPTGIAIGPGGEIFVSDTMNHRVLRMVWQ